MTKEEEDTRLAAWWGEVLARESGAATGERRALLDAMRGIVMQYLLATDPRVKFGLSWAMRRLAVAFNDRPGYVDTWRPHGW